MGRSRRSPHRGTSSRARLRWSMYRPRYSASTRSRCASPVSPATTAPAAASRRRGCAKRARSVGRRTGSDLVDVDSGVRPPFCPLRSNRRDPSSRRPSACRRLRGRRTRSRSRECRPAFPGRSRPSATCGCRPSLGRSVLHRERRRSPPPSPCGRPPRAARRPRGTRCRARRPRRLPGSQGGTPGYPGPGAESTSVRKLLDGIDTGTLACCRDKKLPSSGMSP